MKPTHGMVDKAGGRLQPFHTLGKHDFVMILEVPAGGAVMATFLCLCGVE